jgi:coenzyme F420-0:L-glutamate ligase/coenzyme F420-1:gamma-L-glutamate ligase
VSYSVRPVTGIPEIDAGTDLATVIAAHAPDLADGDIVVVSSKIVSKAEGRVVPGEDRRAAIRSETVRVVAERGETQIVQTRHGFVMAAAGVDNSNVAVGSLVLLPVDPDASARAIRAGLGGRVGVIVTDTFGRAWRVGQTDLAIGAAGVRVLDEHHGRVDAHGNELAVTAPAIADEVAGAAELAMGKLSDIPVAVVSGLSRWVLDEDGPGVRALVRPPEEDMFRLGTREAQRETLTLPRTVDALAERPVDPDAVQRIAALAVSGDGWGIASFAAKPWTDALGLPSSVPFIAVPYVTTKRSSTLLMLGAALDRLLLACTIERLGAVHVSFEDVRKKLLQALPDGAVPVTLIAVGAPQIER